ncbi:hypothetical protein SDC9_42686 [bioreactor metagenome]|uniref:Uncharacterized protein n=1 Tax=bioreactor metagenome TaxID=1076179 RepID=A0A644VYF6_9ZZZZ
MQLTGLTLLFTTILGITDPIADNSGMPTLSDTPPTLKSKKGLLRIRLVASKESPRSAA